MSEESEDYNGVLVGYSIQLQSMVDPLKPNEELGFCSRLDQAIDLMDLIRSAKSFSDESEKLVLYKAVRVEDLGLSVEGLEEYIERIELIEMKPEDYLEVQ
jgi:hypothetical protein